MLLNELGQVPVEKSEDLGKCLGADVPPQVGAVLRMGGETLSSFCTLATVAEKAGRFESNRVEQIRGMEVLDAPPQNVQGFNIPSSFILIESFIYARYLRSPGAIGTGIS